MCVLRRLTPLALAVLLATISASLIPAYAAGSGEGDGSPTAKPRPDFSKKVVTEDDLDTLLARYGGRTKPQTPALTEAPAQAAQAVAVRARVQLPNEQNPEWYAQQVVTLQAQLDATDASISRLQQFRNSASTNSDGLRVGLGLYAPCDGITTDNQIQQLALRRQELTAKIDAIGDLARSNGFAPGMIRSSFEISQAAALKEGRTVTPAQAQAVLKETMQFLSAELAQTQGTIVSMNQQGASQSFTLLQLAPNAGGNMTTDLLDTLHSRSSQLQEEIGDVQDTAAEIGIPPASLQ
jgi:hypothetical protein